MAKSISQEHTHKLPDWLGNAVFYEIYPQSFYDTNADGIGDFQGILQKLDYIQGLGCNAIWMNPCFDSPFMDAGYDVRNYMLAAPRYGTNADLKQLFDAVHARGMHLLLDLVPGHTSYQHEWFRMSMQAEQNEYTDRYVWTDAAFGPPPEGLQTLRGISDRDGAAVVNFFSTQPALNYGFYQPDPEQKWQQAMDAPGPMATRKAVLEVMRFWLGLGCDGFRVDMAGSLVKNDPEGKGTIQLWQELRAALEQDFPEAVLVSEWGEPEKSIAASFDMDFLLHFGPSHYVDLYHCDTPWFSEQGVGTTHAFLEKYQALYEETAGRGLICMISGNHDMERMSLYLSSAEQRLAFTMLLTMPGTPFIYYGDEIGMRYQRGLTSNEGGFFRTGARTPMQWDSTPNAGFSAAAPEQLYLPVDPAAGCPTVAAQEQDPDSLLHQVRKLIAFRQAHPALQSFGTIAFLSEDKPLAYRRTSGTEALTVVINPAAAPAVFDCGCSRVLLTVGAAAVLKNGVVTLPGCSAVILA